MNKEEIEKSFSKLRMDDLKKENDQLHRRNKYNDELIAEIQKNSRMQNDLFNYKLDNLNKKLEFYKNACRFYTQKMDEFEILKTEVSDFKETAKDLLKGYRNCNDEENIKLFDFEYLVKYFD
jgi:hypothetical protein